MPFCRNCGAEYIEGTKFCQKCGSALQPVAVAPAPIAAVGRKEAGIAALIGAIGGLLLFGLGHFYVGKIGRGLAFLLVGIILKIALVVFYFGGVMVFLFGGSSAAIVMLILVAILNLGVWIWQIYDPYALAKTYNAEVERTGKSPW
jgi:hypothetical protein